MFLRKVLAASAVFILLVVALLFIYFSRHIFDPIKNITDQVKTISTENIHLRVDTVHSNQEMQELVNTFNDLLSRIETAFETQKNFISNASHELGTPLTAIIGEADVCLMKNRTTDEYRTSLTNISVQAGRLQEITSSLFFLAQTGYTNKGIVLERLRIDEVIWETKEVIDRLNPLNRILINTSLLPDDPVKLKINGNRQLLQLAFANIMNNACKYSGNREVVIHIASSDSHVVIITEDKGIGIPESDMPFIYDPFFRAGNTKMFEGYGIGLPLSRNIVLLHKGQLTVKSIVNQGTTVQVKIPLMKL
jgi:signal transduction histidine kinase